MDNEHFPHTLCLQELYWRDLYFFNYHINHDKMAWFYESFDPAEAHRLEDHFSFWDPDHWTVTTTEESGAASEAITPYIGSGVLLVVNGMADDDSDEISTQCTWPFVKSIPLFFEIRAKLSDSLLTTTYVGMVDGLLFGGYTLDGFYFYKPDTGRDVYFVVVHGGVAETIDTGVDCQDVAWVRLCAHYDGDRTIRWFIVGDDSGLILASGQVALAYSPLDLLYFVFGIQNGEAESKALYVDYIKVVGKVYTGDAFDEQPR
jgi:hypothetical protein